MNTSGFFGLHLLCKIPEVFMILLETSSDLFARPYMLKHYKVCNLTPFCIVRSNVKNILMFSTFGAIIGGYQVKCKKNDHTC